MDLAVQVTLAIFCAGVIFHTGRLTSRVESIEKWREEITADIKRIAETTGYIDGALRGERHK